MKILPAVFGLLFIANVALYFWPQEPNVASHIRAAKPEFNTNLIRLNKEVRNDFAVSQEKSIGDTNTQSSNKKIDNNLSVQNNQSSQTTPKPPLDNKAKSQVTNAQSKESEVCYRVGPFLEKANYELAQITLKNENINFNKITRTAKNSNIIRTYIGPFKTKAEAEDVRTDLKRKKLHDHFLKQQENGEFIISLGVFSSVKTATLAIELLKSFAPNAKMAKESIVLPKSYWLTFAKQDDFQGIDKLLEINWGEKSAKIGVFACQ